jgi:hypothetical protein
MNHHQVEEKNVEKFLETLFSELTIAKDLPTLQSMQTLFNQMTDVVKTSTNPLNIPDPAFLSTESIGIPVNVTYAQKQKKPVIAQFQTKPPALTFLFKNKSYAELYNKQFPFQIGLSVFADMLAIYIASSFSEEEKVSVNRRCVTFLRAKHIALNMSLTGFAEEEKEFELANRLDMLASAAEYDDDD